MDTNSEKKIIEVNGVKLEIDMRYAKSIETYHVGDSVKIFEKQSYGNKMNVYPGIIIGFAEGNNGNAGIEILYIKNEYSTPEIKSAIICNGVDNEFSLAHLSEYDDIFKKDEIVKSFNRKIEELELNLASMINKKALFIEQFSKSFEANINNNNNTQK
jgi:uncharacterized protein YqkB